MTPKEKAIELVLIFKQRTSYREVFHTIELLDKFHNNAKNCALIAVDMIINALPPFEYGLEFLAKIEFWQQVKKEIEAL